MRTSCFAWCALTIGMACTAQAPQQLPFGAEDPGSGASADPGAAAASGVSEPVTEPGAVTAPAGAAEPAPRSGTSPPRASADAAGVRYAGGETTDFGNGSNSFDPCGMQEELEDISREQAEALGFDVAAQIAWLAEPHRSTLSWNPTSCAGLGAQCSDTGMTLSVQVTDFLLLQRSYQHPGGSCPSAPTQHLAYRGAVHLETDDAQLAGTFYARLTPAGAETEGDRLVGSAMPDLRNFSGSLPLRLELERTHFAYSYVDFALSRDGQTSGFFEPDVQYYDAARGSARISADASWNDGRAFSDEPVPSGTASTLRDYPGSHLAPLVALSVRADAVDPAVDVIVTVSVGDRVVRDTSVPAGTYVELGAQPFGTRVSVDVRNPNAAGVVRASILQDDCFVASSSCTQPDCAAHAEYIAYARRCTN